MTTATNILLNIKIYISSSQIVGPQLSEGPLPAPSEFIGVWCFHFPPVPQLRGKSKGRTPDGHSFECTTLLETCRSRNLIPLDRPTSKHILDE